jgi:hypothetical protein
MAEMDVSLQLLLRVVTSPTDHFKCGDETLFHHFDPKAK